MSTLTSGQTQPPGSGMQASGVIETLLESFSVGVVILPTLFEIPQLQVQPSQLLAVAGWLKDKGFNMLQDVGGVDYLPRIPRFEVVYHLMSVSTLQRIRLRVPVPAEQPQVPTLSLLWPSANAAEREVYDLFGIIFTNHPELSRIMMPAEWEGHPLRKDYPLQGPRAAEMRLAADKGRYHAPRNTSH